MKNNQQILDLLEQIIQYNIYQDLKNKQYDGENWNVYHLKLLKNLIISNEK